MSGEDGARPSTTGRWPPLRYLAAATAVVLLVLASFRFIAAAQQFVFLAIFAVLLAAILHVPLSWLARRMPRPLAASITLVGALAVVAAIVLLTVPLVVTQGAILLEQAPRAIVRAERWWQEATRSTALDGLHDSVQSTIWEQLSHWASKALPLALSTIGVVATTIVLLALAMFLAYQPRVYLNGMVRLMPRRHVRPAVVLLRRIGAVLRGWMIGSVIAMTVVGVLTAVGLAALGIDSWLVLAIINFFGEFIPYLGPVLAALPGIAVGFADSPMTGVYVTAVYFGVQQIENHLLQPLIMRRTVRVQPALLIVWQLAFAGVFGLVGLLVAAPVLAVGQVAVQYLYVERVLHKRSIAPVAPGDG